MNIKKHIPNLFTLGNLFCGILATLAAVNKHYESVAVLVVIGILLDFFDGFLARLLKVSGELGKQLDSLADMVTSGVVPGIVMFKMYEDSLPVKDNELESWIVLLSFMCFLLTLGAAYRLAKFNIDTRQSDSFIGLPTPAMSLFIVSIPLIYLNTDIEFVKELITNSYVLIGTTLLLTYLMNAEIRLLSLKFKHFGVAENKMKYLLIISSIILFITLQYLAVPLIILLYVLLSMIENALLRKA